MFFYQLPCTYSMNKKIGFGALYAICTSHHFLSNVNKILGFEKSILCVCPGKTISNFRIGLRKNVRYTKAIAHNGYISRIYFWETFLCICIHKNHKSKQENNTLFH